METERFDIYTYEQLRNDLIDAADFVKKSPDSNIGHIPPELKHLIFCLTSTNDDYRNNDSLRLLYIFSLFVSSQKNYLYNKRYLNEYIKHLPDFIDRKRKYIILALKHFNLLIKSIPESWQNSHCISYDRFLQFQYSTKLKRWRAYINQEELISFARKEDDKAQFELFNTVQEAILAITFSESQCEGTILQILETSKHFS